MATKYTNLKVIVDKIMRHPMLTDISYETIIDYTIDFLRIVGVPTLFLDKVVPLCINNYRCAIPTDFIELIQIVDSKTKECLRKASDTLVLSNSCKKESSIDKTYFIQGSVLYTSFVTGRIEMAYRAIGVDTDGYPLLPDNPKLFRALEQYVKLQKFTYLFDMGKITPAILQNTQQDYSFAVGACETEFLKLDLSDAETLFNTLKSLVPRENEFKRHFLNTGNKGV
jgi:hypothetical protein